MSKIFKNLAEKRLYQIWADMKRRCYTKHRENYKYYGARGIAVCDEWKNNFESFEEWALANGYKEHLTIDRIDVNGNYEPSNCRWLTVVEQNNNRRNNKVLEFEGKRHTISEWSRITGIDKSTINKSIYQRGWSIEDALMIKDGRKARLWV